MLCSAADGTGASRPMDELQPGDPASVGSYRLLGRLGAGGMGQVFLGMSPGGRKVAVKLIHPVHARTATFRERFAREIEAVQRVGGFHTAPVVDADPHADPPWMVTAYVAGPSLQYAVGRDGPLPPGRVQALGAALAEGLDAIHARGLVHRDLKPGNVILAADGPRIIDFGIARAAGVTTLTATGVVMGTFAYMSPEQIRGEATGPPSDVFSLGCVLAFAATGRLPFGGDSAATVMFRIVSQPPDLTGLAEQELAGLIGVCLAKSPQDRPAVPALLAALGSQGPPPGPAGVPDHAEWTAGSGTPEQTLASAPQTGPGREALPPSPPLPVPGVAARPLVPGRGLHARRAHRRPRRWTASVIGAMALAAALAIALPVLFTAGTDRAAASHRPVAEVSVGRTATTPVKTSLDPAATKHRRTLEITARSTIPATSPSTKPAASSSFPANRPRRVEIPAITRYPIPAITGDQPGRRSWRWKPPDSRSRWPSAPWCVVPGRILASGRFLCTPVPKILP